VAELLGALRAWTLTNQQELKNATLTCIKQIGDIPSVAEGSRPHQSDSITGLLPSSWAGPNEKAPGVLQHQ